MKIVIDTNVLISGIFWKGLPYKVLSLWLDDQIELIITKNILKEYLEVIIRIDSNQNLAEKWQKLLLKNTKFVEDKSLIKLSRDPQDDKFINCALIGKASYIVSGDQDLLSLQEVSKIKIVNPAAFLKIWKKEIKKKAPR